MRRPLVAVLGVLVLLLAGCGGTGGADDPPKAQPSAGASTEGHDDHGDHADLAADKAPETPLRAGERRETLQIRTPYTPRAPYGVGTDDYHCFLLDPKLAKDTFVTGYDIRPQKLSEVHHVILFRITPDQVAAARQKDDTTPGQGWTCFGNSGIEDGPAAQLNDSSWIGAWAPGGGEVTYGGKLGVSMPQGSMIVAQVHYNLLGGTTPDQSSVVLRQSDDPRTTGLRTVLLPAPVELPCRPDNRGPLCDRDKAVADVKARFGQGPGATADLLHFLCPDAEAGIEQTCDRRFGEPMTIRGVAGHMHLLGTSISVVADPGTPRERTLLDIPSWNFDDQGARMLPKPYTLRAGEKIRITCHHQQRLRDQQPSFEKQRQDRYVVWGDGSTDEMCLGMLLVSSPA